MQFNQQKFPLIFSREKLTYFLTELTKAKKREFWNVDCHFNGHKERIFQNAVRDWIEWYFMG